MDTRHGRIEWDPKSHYQDVQTAEKYDIHRFSSLAGRVFNAWEKRLVGRAFAGLPKNSTVIDVPCGTGRHAEHLLQAGFRVTGTDISAAMLHVAQRKLAGFGQQFEVVVSDVVDLAKTEKKAYDAALCARVLMHFPLDKQIEFLRAVTALARERVVFTQSIDSAYQRFRRRAKGIFLKSSPAAYPITETELAELLGGAGLRMVERYRILPAISEANVIVAEPL